MIAILLLTACAAMGDTTVADSTVVDTATRSPAVPSVVFDTARRFRPRAIEYSEWYHRRLVIHQIGAYTELPLFGAEWYLGDQLYRDARLGRPRGGLRMTHAVVASGIGVLFASNTVTGLWNLWEARHDPIGRPRRTAHALVMTLADAGFAWTAGIGMNAKLNTATANAHRTVAFTSMGIATAGTLMMWLWRDK